MVLNIAIDKAQMIVAEVDYHLRLVVMYNAMDKEFSEKVEIVSWACIGWG